MAEPLLTLQTIEPDRPFIVIDHVRYDLAVPEDFGLIESAQIARLMQRAMTAQKEAQDLPPEGSLDEPAVDRLSRILDEVLALVLRAPDNVRSALNSSQKLAVVTAFGPAVLKRSQPPQELIQDRSTSVNSSRSSRRRTARRTGTTCPSVS